MESENKQVNQKQVLGEKKKSWWRTGLKIGAGILGAGLLGALGSKMGGNRQNVATNQNLDTIKRNLVPKYVSQGSYENFKLPDNYKDTIVDF